MNLPNPSAFHVVIESAPTLATDRIQTAIDQAQTRPVRVVLEPGVHLSHGLKLRTDVELHLSKGAELRFVPSYAAYAETVVDVIAEESNRAMITATNAERIAITGEGTIECDGTEFSSGDNEVMGTRIPLQHRPRVLVLDSCRNVWISEFSVKNSPMWTLHFIDNEGLRISNLTIKNDLRMPNTDGIVIDSCRDVSITGSNISTADDGIVLKTSARISGAVCGPCRDINVSKCRIESRSCALKIGTESYSPFQNITFEDCHIVGSNRALGIFSRDGGAVENIRFSRINLTCTETPSGYWGSGEALTVNALDRRPDTRAAGTVSNLVIEDISGTMEGAINLVAERRKMIREVTIRRVKLDQKLGPLGTGLCYDLRPTPSDLQSSPNETGLMNAWRLGPDGRVIGLSDYPDGMPGIYTSGVEDLSLDDVKIIRPKPLPEEMNVKEVVTD